MKARWSDQYAMFAVVLEEEDLPSGAEDTINFAITNEATKVFPSEGKDPCFCVQFPGRPMELYSEEALRGSF